MALEQDCLLDLWKIQMSFHRSVCGIIGKRSETIVISFHAVTFIIIILVFRHAKFTPPFNATAICTEASKYAVAYLLFFSHLPSFLSFLQTPSIVRCMICGTDARRCSSPWLQVVWVPFRGGLASTNPLVSVDCQASRPTHSTMWVYSVIWDRDCICPLLRPEEPLKNAHEPKLIAIHSSLKKGSCKTL